MLLHARLLHPLLLCSLVMASAATQAAETRLAIDGLDNGRARLRWTTSAGQPAALEASSNLADWTEVAAFPDGAAGSPFLDAASPVPGPRFYRLRLDPGGPSGDPVRHLVGLAGYGLGNAGLGFANGTMLTSYRHLMTVDPRAPSPATRVVEAGTYGSDAENFIHQNSVLEAQVDPATGGISGLGIRFSVFARDGRLWKLDHRAVGAPVPVLWSTLAVTNICSTSYTLRRVAHDFADASKSWVFVSVPRSTGGCAAFPEDVIHLGLRLDMGPDDAPLEVGRPVSTVYSPGGAIQGFVVQQGAELRRVDASFANPVVVHTDPGPHPLINGRPLIPALNRGVQFGADRPGFWLFIATHQGLPEFLLATDLAAATPGPARPLFRLPTETASADGNALFSHRTESDGQNLFLAIRQGLSTSSIVRIDPDLSFRTLAGVTSRVDELTLTDTHVVVREGRNIRAVPKDGGELRLLGSLPATEEFVQHPRIRWAVRGIEGVTVRWRALLPAGTNVWFEGVTLATPKRNQLHAVGTGPDSAPASYPSRSIITWAAPTILPWNTDPSAQMLYVADQRVPRTTPPTDLRTDFAGMPVRALNGATREEAFVLGELPAPTQRIGNLTNVAVVSKSPVMGAPLQQGQPGLIPVTGRPTTSTGTTAGVDLLFFRSDAPGLVPVTRFGLD